MAQGWLQQHEKPRSPHGQRVALFPLKIRPTLLFSGAKPSVFYILFWPVNVKKYFKCFVRTEIILKIDSAGSGCWVLPFRNPVFSNSPTVQNGNLKAPSPGKEGTQKSRVKPTSSSSHSTILPRSLVDLLLHSAPVSSPSNQVHSNAARVSSFYT